MLNCHTVISQVQLNKSLYHSDEVKDFYKQLENIQNDSVRLYYNNLNTKAKQILNSIPGDTLVQSKLKGLFNRAPYFVYKPFVLNNDTYFYRKYTYSTDNTSIYVRHGFEGEEQKIFNPAEFELSNDYNYKINYFRPSWDGKFLAVALSHSGRETSEIFVLDIDKKQLLDVRLPGTKPAGYYGINWLPDNSGFTYLHFPNSEINDFKESETVLYSLDDRNNSNPRTIFSKKNNSSLPINDTHRPIVNIPFGTSKYAFAYIKDTGNYWDVYYTSIHNLKKNKIHWNSLFTRKDKVYRDYFFVINETIYFKSALAASNYKIAYTTMKARSFQNPITIIPQFKDKIIDNFIYTPSGIVYNTLKNGIEAEIFHFQNRTKKSEEILLPFASGSISIDYHCSDSFELVSVLGSGWTTEGIRFLYNSKTKNLEEKMLSPKSLYPEFDDIIVEEIEVKSHDGVFVPLSLILNKNIKKDGKNPVWLTGYGAYGDNSKAIFSPILLKFVSEGGIYAVAHVRGGGEKGDKWYKAGYKITKSNTWKDAIACAKYLAEQGWSSPEHTAIFGSSAGGIMAARAALEKPNQFSALVVHSGLLNPFRRSQLKTDQTTKEFGSYANLEERKALMEMDAFENLKKGTAYPATLLSVGWNDERTPPWMSGKFAARMQECTSSDEPVILRIEKMAGHGSGNAADQFYSLWSDLYRFIFWKTGHPDYQPKKEAPE